jgi:hypothetical protein
VDTVGDGLVRKEHSRDARAAAFWFMAAAPAAWLTGYLVESALRAGDRRAVSVAGRTAVSLGALVTAVIPRSGFAGLTSLGFWLLALARRMAHSTHDEPRPSRGDRVPTVLWQRDAPEVIRSLDTLAGPDYVDIFTATAAEAADTSPEQWVRAVLERVPAGMRRFVPLAHRFLLGLRLEPRPSPDHLLGWKIADRGDSWLRIEAASWFMTAHCVLHVDDRQVSLATFVRYDRRLAALVWPPVSIIHRQVGLALMRHAVRAP